MTTQRQASARLARAELRVHRATEALEAFCERYGYAGSPLQQQALERDYRAARRALRSAHTAYGTLATAHHWNAP